MRNTAKTLTRLALLTAVALALGFAESFFILIPTVPGIKLGLANIAVLCVIYRMDGKHALALVCMKVLLSGLLYAGMSMAMFSLAGGLLSLGAMLLAKRFAGLSMVGVSVVGGVFHNVGQLLLAAFVVNTRAMLAFLPILLVAGAVTGVLTGLAAQYAIRALDRTEVNP